MNILYLTNHLNTGGITSYVLSLGSGLVKRGHNVYVASGAGEKLSRFIREGILYIPVPMETKKEIGPNILISIWKLTGFIRRNKIDIIHSNSRTTQVLGALLKKRSPAIHIFTCHGFFKPRLLRRIFPCWGEKVIAISQQVKVHLVEDFNVREDNIVVINHGIDVEKFKVRSHPSTSSLGFAKRVEGSLGAGKSQVESRRDFSLGEGPVIGIIARLSDVKGHVYLIEAMKNVCAKIPQAQLLIVGEGRMEKELRRRVSELNLEKNIIFIPDVEDTAKVLSVLDVFVMPSLKEGLGLALMEAMASALPVVGSDIGGIKSLIKDGDNGLLAQPADALGISRAIISLLESPDKARVLGEGARDFIVKNFSQEKMIQQTEGVYSECINSRR